MMLLKCLSIFVVLYLKIPNISCKGSTIAFAIDDTRTMGSVIDEVKREASTIMNTMLAEKSSEIKEFVLITINDPDVVLRAKTKSPSIFLKSIQSISVHNSYQNNECEEMSLHGIEKALKASGPDGSYIFVFTDAYAKDYENIDKVKKLCQKKKGQVVFVLTGDCEHPSDRRYTVYYEIAAACSGQVFRVKKNEIHTVIEPIKIFLKRKHSLVTWTIKPRSDTYVQVPFTITENADYALVSVSDGKKGKLRISTTDHLGPQMDSKILMQNDYGKINQISNLQPGTYYAYVKGKSVTSLMVYVPTPLDFTFDYNFSALESNSMKDTYKQPTAGKQQDLSINVTDPEHAVNIQSVQILNMNDDVIRELPVRKTHDNYIADAFVVPTHMFKIKVIGIIQKTGQSMTKTSSAIEPTKVVIPDVHIDEGAELEAKYGSKVSLTCKVYAHPPPTIEWSTANGVVLLSESYDTVAPQYISYLELKYINETNTFVCKATNTETSRTSQIRVYVQPIIQVVTIPEAKTTAKFGEDVKIQCIIKSSMPIEIKWFRSGRELTNTDEHSISADGSELTLKSMDLEMQGNYICEAFLISDPTKKQTHETVVTIPGLALPLIERTNRKIYVTKRDNKAELNCRTVGGYPKPHVQWFKKNGNKFELLSHDTSEVLTVKVREHDVGVTRPRVFFTHAGHYKCVAENVLGSEIAEFVVIPESEPDVNIDGGNSLYVDFGAEVSLTCKVTGHPLPTIEWLTTDGLLLPSETTVIEETSYISSLNRKSIKKNETFVCKAMNTEGRKIKQIQVEVRPVFNVSTVPAANTIAKYGEDVKIQCNIKSYVPMKIKWFRFGRELIDTDVYSISADGSELTLKSMDLRMLGKYTCEASLDSDPTKTETYETEVQIPGLSRPVFENKNWKISLKKGDNKAELSCKTARGYPKPQVQWFKKNGSNFELLSHETSEVLTVPRTSYTGASHYKCVAENVLGTDTAQFVVIPHVQPDVTIDEGANLYVDYGAAVFLTCRITAHPPPKIRWFTIGGKALPFETTVTEAPSYLSYLSLRNIKKNETYVCKAKNKEGSKTAQAQINVRPIFNVISVPAAQLTAKYGEEVKIQCIIQSYLPITIKWFRSGRKLTNTDDHSISTDGSELTLNSMDLGTQGKYVCEVSLNSNPTEKLTHETVVIIPGLERPVIKSRNNKMYLKKRDHEAELNCKTVRGYPKPDVKWFKKNDNTFELLPHETSEVLTVPKALFTHASQYRCTVENVMGSDSAEFVVIPEGEPDVNIDEGNNLNVDYEAGVTLTCKVSAHPRPAIEWLTAGGFSMLSETIDMEEPSYISYLRLKNIKKNETYVCKATNTEGTRTKQTQVDVKPVFIVLAEPEAKTAAKYGEDVKIQCNIQSHLPVKVKWFRSGTELSNTDEHSISDDGLELTLKSMNLGMEGRYSCEASLKSDPTVKQTHETIVTIPGLAPPVINSMKRKLYVKKNENEAELNCKSVSGNPKPHVQWFKKSGNKFELLSHETGEVLTVPRASFTHASQYKCVVENVKGSDSAEFVLISEGEPDVNIDEGNNLNVDYEAGVTLTCKVTAHPLPTIEWLTAGGISLPSETIDVGEPSYISYLRLKNIKQNETYVCKATNTEGTRTKEAHVDVKPVFIVVAIPAAKTAAKYGEDVKIQCNIQSHLPVKVKWFRSGTELSSTDEHSISDDGLELTLKSMNLGMEGRYSCETSLKSDPAVKETHETIVTIPGLTPPVINSKKNKLYVKKKDNDAELNCKTVSGYPKPHVQWFKKSGNKFELLSHETGEVLTVPRASFTHASQYKCVVENVKGRDSAEFVLISDGEPDVNIDEGYNLTVDYEAEVTLTCKVTAHPRPTIEWFTAGGISMSSETIVIGEPSYISYLRLKNIKKNETYVCKAINTEGTITKQTQVDVKPVFIVVAVPAATTAAKYGEDVKIQCNIKSNLPVQVKWFRSGRELHNTDELSISDNGSELTIKSLDLGNQGKYSCEASLNSDPTVKQTHETIVTIPGLGRPIIESKNTKIYVKKRDNEIELNCKTVSGYPKPHVQWFKQSGNKFELLSHETSEVLTVPRASFTHASQYKCVAENVKGSDYAEFVLISEGEPDVNIDEGNNLNVDYEAGVTLTCKVTAHPHPTIEWLTAGGISLPSEIIDVGEPSYISYLRLKKIKQNETYVCKATNTEGTRTKEAHVDVKPVFIVVAIPAAKTAAKYGEDVKIQCNIQSKLPVKVKWFRSGTELSNTDEHSISDDGLELTLKSMNLGMEGRYSCEASLKSDPTVKQSHETIVTIPGLAPPVIDSKKRKLYVNKKDNEAELSCKTVSGNPKPHVQWFKKSGSKFELLSHETGEVLTVPRSSFMHAGQYKCVVENVKGSDSADFVLISEGEPDVNIDEGNNLNVDYEAAVTLTCKVTAHPPPTIEWLTIGGVSLLSETIVIGEPSYMSYLRLKDIKNNETYVCKATNTEGTITKQTQVDVKPVFIVVAVPAANTAAKYGEDLKMQCNIKSNLPVKVKWFRSGRELNNTDEHYISDDGLELTIKSLDLGMQGRYSCEASLNSDPTVKQTHETIVTIPGLARPIIESKNMKIYVKKRDHGIEINCKTVSGYPKPQVQWFKKSGNKFELLSHETGEVLTVPRASFTPAGKYKCVTENVMGSDSTEIVVIPEGEPEVNIDEGVNLHVDYGEGVTLTCTVTAHPRPTIEWLSADGTPKRSESTIIEEPKYKSYLKLDNIKKNETYVCKATNTEGIRTIQTQVDVRPVFYPIFIPAGDTAATYGEDIKIQCNVKSNFPLNIKWFRSGKELSNTNVHSISADGSELTINSMNLEMEGKYTCEVSLNSDPTEKQTHETVVKIAGLVPPEITDYLTVVNATNFTAICRVKGVPKPTILWQFKPKGSEEFTTIPGSEEELNIPELRLRNSGVYKCIATNLKGKTEQDFNVVVKEHPTIINEEYNYFGVEGDLVLQIPCNVTGFPDPAIIWKEESKTIGNDSKYELKGNVLYIKNPVISDTHNFTCEATNILGFDRAILYTEVTDTFEHDENLYGDTHAVYIEQGKPLTVTCTIVNSKTDSVRWYRNGQKTSQTGNTYIIEKSTTLDDGNYTCRMNTNEGSKSQTFVLDVGMPPVFENDSPSPSTVDWHESDQFLDCAAFSKPESKIEWSHDGKKEESLNDLYQIPVTDWGEYTCAVSNVHGSIHKTFKIITSGCYISKTTYSRNTPLISEYDTPSLPSSISNIGINMAEQEKVKFSCLSDTNTSNAFEIFSSKVEVIAQCDTKDTFIVDGKPYRYKELQCKRMVGPSILNTREECSGPQSEMIRVGFPVNGFLEAFKVCYDTSKNVPLYASAPNHLSHSGIAVDSSAFNWNLAPGLGDGKSTGGYNCEASNKCCYAKDQLLNVDDLAFGPAQLASFTENLNSIAVWNPCNDSNRTSWQYFEKDLKRMSIMYESWSSWTGASEYVSKNGGLVPRFLWKVMNYDGDFSAMVYVNDESPVAKDIRCTKTCESMMESADKFLYCCSLGEFSEVFDIPADSFQLPKQELNPITV